jgi:hypothetical protein
MRVIISFICAIILFIVSLLLIIGSHIINDRYVGIYYRNGALLQKYTLPGYHVKSILTTVHQIDVSEQTDSLTYISCDSSNNINLIIQEIVIVNQLNIDNVIEIISKFGINYDKHLIFDKIKYFTGQICSQKTSDELLKYAILNFAQELSKLLKDDFINNTINGLIIKSIRVTKPIGTDSLMNLYLQEEKEIKNKHIAVLHGEVSNQYSINNHTILMNNLLYLKNRTELEAEISEINNKIESSKIKAQAENNKILITEDYLKYITIQSINGSNLFIGGNIAEMLFNVAQINNIKNNTVN